jgi:hypothetical protein
VGWRSVFAEQLCQAFLNIFVVEASFHANGQALAGVFIDHIQDPKWAPIVCSFRHEVIAPDMVRVFWPQAQARAVICPQSATLGLPAWHFQPFLAPKAFYTLVIDPPAFHPQHGSDAPISIPSILTGQGDDPFDQHLFVVAFFSKVALG